MQNIYTFNEIERQLILDLLSEERRELHSEIHHTDNRGMRDQLKDRLLMVEHLLERLQVVAVQ